MKPIFASAFAARYSVICMMAVMLVACQKSGTHLELVISEQINSPSPGTSHTLHVDQSAGELLLVRLSGFETEFRAGLNAEGISSQPVSTWYLRLPPLFLLMPESEFDRSLEVVIEPLNTTSNASVSMQVFRWIGSDAESSMLIEAFSLYQSAMEVTDSEAREVWQPRVEKLRQAADYMAELDMLEESLWASSMHAFFHYYPLYDNSAAIELSGELFEQAIQGDFDEIALMNLSTKAQAMLERDSDDSVEETLRKQREAQGLFAEAIELADQAGLYFERAWAINNRGIGYYYLDEPAEALVWYEQALEEARELDDPYFLNLVRGNLILAREQQGDFQGQLDVLTSINGELREQGHTDRLIHNLNDMGRLYRLLYRFPESIEVLTEAKQLALETNDEESFVRAGLWLATAYRSMGYQERAREILLDSIPGMENVNNGRLLREAHQVAANMARRDKRFMEMQSHRESQRELVGSDANMATWYYDRGLDAVAAGEGDAFLWFADAMARYKAAKFERMVHTTRLRLCALGVNETGEHCDLNAARESVDWITAHGSPAHQLTAREIWGQILIDQDDLESAVVVLESLIEDLAFYRQTLPGVLGAWYWDRRDALFDLYMGLVINQDLALGQGKNSLLALGQLRNIGVGSASMPAAGDDVARLRSVLLQLERSDADERQSLELEIDQLLLSVRAPQVETEQESRTIRVPDDTSVLAFHVSETGAWRWHVTGSGAELTELADRDLIWTTIESLRANFRVTGYESLEVELDRLGQLLLGDLSGSLPGTIHLLAGGVLNGLPFDALRLDGQYLAENHVLVNRLSFADYSAQAEAMDVGQLFLAGNPISNDSMVLASAKTELDAVEAAFSSAQVHRLESGELNRDAFASDEFRSADLVHIASHGRLDPRYPELSRIMLSSDGEEDNFLTPGELAGSGLQARLVVLSACESVGSSQFRWDAGVGFVSELASENDRMIIASLWPIADQFAAEFFALFYSKAAGGMTPPAALAMTKRELTATGSVSAWAAFQLSSQ